MRTAPFVVKSDAVLVITEATEVQFGRGRILT